MKSISIAAVQIRNYKSFVEETVIFPEIAGLYFLKGANELEPRLEANGAGKSSLWDAIVWCLYGRSIQGIRTSQIMRWGAQNVRVGVTLAVDGVFAELARTGPPDRFSLDNDPTTQEEVEQLLGLTRERFLNSIIFGQGQPLFPDLSVTERGQLFDDILGLELWNRCSEIAKQRVTNAQATIQGFKLQLANIEGQLEALPSEEELQEKANRFEEECQDQLNTKIVEVDGCKEQLTSHRKALAAFNNVTPAEEDKLTTVENSIRHLRSSVVTHSNARATATAKLDRLRKDLRAAERGVCDACGQALPDAVSRVKKIKADIAIEEANEFNGEELRAGCQRQVVELEESNQHFRDLIINRRADKKLIELRIQTCNEQLERLAVDIDQIEKRPNPHTEILLEVVEERALLNQGKDNYTRDINDAIVAITALEYWKAAFKQIRLYYIGEVLASLGAEVAAAMNSLGLIGWLIQFVTETENKSGTIKLGVQIEITDPRGRKGKYEDFGSGGEDQRIRLAIGLGMASLIQRPAGVSWDIEVYDEPTQWLSGPGVEDLLSSLAHRAESQKKTIWVVDHRALAHSGFKEIWTVRKDADGSKVITEGR